MYKFLIILPSINYEIRIASHARYLYSLAICTYCIGTYSYIHIALFVLVESLHVTTYTRAETAIKKWEGSQ